ncbi:apolipoprotein N-acyltransferase [Rhizobium sp. SSA_523]|uniref:apolipoprotein N-acyltransferase n=1 Tax=Rhizobium sp. SSA_523 TaxID=2952477 RepID=UPI0020919C83|nr:apolipoprotein N-acyltransferase [Rhizobium sp. SSA_523]MCO5732623.1 apolipoprotein N-acyltransferase [Rhizobium sp. SSA_523]WKC23744.1 apolipoprotein N-acyltransferase [Rhizobium sp. SSA_523]
MERLANRVILLWGWRRALLAIASGAFAALALPPVSFVAALFVSFPLLVWLMDGLSTAPGSGFLARSRSTILIGWLFGFGYFVAGLWWLGSALLVEADEYAWALPLAVLGLPAVLAIFYGLATWIAGLFWSDGFGRLTALALGFGLAEWLRSFVLTGFPWNAIGYGVMPIPLMMQTDQVIGLFGVSALAVFVAAAPALLGTRRGMLTGLALALALACAHLGYGAYRLSDAPPLGAAAEAGPSEAGDISVRIVQPVIDQAQKMDINDRVAVFQEHLDLTALPPRQGQRRPDIIIWPETSVPFILTQYRDALVRIADVLQDGQILLAGVVRTEDGPPGEPPRYYNSVYAIDSQGQILAAADKVHLTPFGEYLPFESIFNALGIGNIVNVPGGFTAGAGHALLTLPGGQTFYPLICYEAIFPDEIEPSSASVSALLNITNDAWFGNTPGPYQHFLQSRLRAVETGRSLIRGANNGISAYVDPYGRIVSKINLDDKAVLDSTLGRFPVSKWDNYTRNNNFWLIISTLLVIAIVSRLGPKLHLN